MKHGSSRHFWWLAPVLIVAFLVAAVDLLHWNALKPVIIERVEETTGRQVAVRGDVGIDLFPRPQLTLEDVTLDNPDWAEAEHLLEARRITLTPALGDLLRGQVSWDEAGVSDATLNLEQRADAPGNWHFDTGREERQTQEDSASRLPLRQLSIADSQVHYRAAQAEIPLEFSLSSLEIQADDEALHTEAMLSFRERRFELEADTDPIANFTNAAQAFTGDVSLSSEESQFTATFEAPGAPSLERLQLDAELNLQELADWARWLDLPPIELDQLEATAHFERDGSQWRLHDIEASAAESRLGGELVVDTSGEAPTFDGRLSSPELDVAALREAMPESEEETAVSVPVLPDWRGEVALSVERIQLADTLIRNAQGRARLAEHTVSLAPFSFELADGNVEGEAQLTSDPETLEARARLSLQDIDPAQLGVGQDPGATLDADLALALGPLPQRDSHPRDTLLEQLRIVDAQAAYRHVEAGNDLEATLESTAGKQPTGLRLTASGTLLGEPLDLRASGAPLPELFDLQTGSLRRDYPFAAQATSGRLEAATEATLDLLLSPETFAIDLTLDDASGRALENWIGPVLPPLPGYRLAGRLSRDGEQWAANGVEGMVGSTPVAGNVEVHATERPEITADIEAGRIELAQFIPADQASDDTARDESLLAPLRSFDGELDLQADALVLPNELVLQDLALDAELDSGRLQADLSRFRLADGSLSGALTLDAGSAPASGHLDLVFDDIALSRLGDTFTTVEDRLGRLSGDLHLDVSEALPGVRRNDLLLPFLGHLSFAPSELRFVDPRAGTDLTLRLETQGAGSGNQTFRLQGEGRYDGAPASLTLQGDPLLDARDPDRPYAVELEADLVDTSIQLQGSLMRPLALAGLDLQLAVEGPNPQRLSRLLGVSLPELPPYAVSGDVQLEDQRWTFRNMQGQVGDSDLAGRLALDVGVTPPRLEGKLSSRFLELEDLGFLAGATPEETADDRFVLPDTPIVTEGWQGVSADVSFRGESVRAGNLPLSDVTLDFELEDGRGRFAPLRFGVEEGSVDLTLDIDSSTRPPSGTVQVEVKRLDLNDALQHWELADESVGTIAGRGKLWIEGASIAELLASADGGVVALMTGGKLDALLVELAGIDAGQTFLSWARGRGPIPIDCAYADLQARDGVAQMDTFVVDTSDTTFTLGGQLDLNREQVDVSIIAHPKDPSLFVGRSPLHLGGTFSDLDLDPHRQGLALRAGASVALGALASPITALLPLLEFGAGPDVAYCQGLISRSRGAIADEEAD
ncbi:AsmA family protein [Billgrantia antri]|uniref:AsmA family protein n=1 Tax=Halomonas sulfidivorans TaxID=2733488 RepID=A0ABX7WMT3_9GAMM|nr:AsmA family protein [Halomonas sulfidivorans]QTP60842.1 AsmA family protein [Halomonas sulfidivorans]